MNFRLKAFQLHLLASAAILTCVLGALFLGWYHWPGWYLSGALRVVAMLIGVDAALGPLLTFVIANPAKPRRELKRDISLIVAVQLIALAYGTATLWNGRPLYYAFSVNMLELVQASDLDPADTELARRAHDALAPHWYSLPRWIWAPLPADAEEREHIVQSAITGGADVTAMPSHFRPWRDGAGDLRKQLMPVGDLRFYSGAEIQRLKRRMAAAGFAAGERNAIPLMGRGRPLLAVFDRQTLKLLALIGCTR